MDLESYDNVPETLPHSQPGVKAEYESYPNDPYRTKSPSPSNNNNSPPSVNNNHHHKTGTTQQHQNGKHAMLQQQRSDSGSFDSDQPPSLRTRSKTVSDAMGEEFRLRLNQFC